jgi:hypothetical protein
MRKPTTRSTRTTATSTRSRSGLGGRGADEMCYGRAAKMILLRRPRLPPRPFFCVHMCRRRRNRPRSFDRNRPPSATRCRPKKLCPGTAAMAELSRRMSRLNPTFAPCLPRPAKDPPAGPGWIHEIKHDGFRILARRDRERVGLFTRHGTDLPPATQRLQPRSRACRCGHARSTARPSSSIRTGSLSSI